MKRPCVSVLHVVALCLSAGVAVAAQSSSQAQAPSNRLVAPGAIDDSWRPVTRLAPNTLLSVTAKKGGGHCVLQSVSESGLVCLHGSSTREVRRDDIARIRFSHRGRSSAAGFAAGAAIGAGIGAGIAVGINSSDRGSLLHVSGGKSAGVGAALGVILGGTAGAVVGYSTELFAGPLIYKR